MVPRVPDTEGFHTVQNEPMHPVFDEGPARKPERRARNALHRPCARTREKQKGSETRGRGTEKCEIEPRCELAVLQREQRHAARLQRRLRGRSTDRLAKRRFHGLRSALGTIAVSCASSAAASSALAHARLCLRVDRHACVRDSLIASLRYHYVAQFARASPAALLMTRSGRRRTGCSSAATLI